MKTNIYIWLIFIVVISAFAVVGWFSAQCDISKWAEILVNLTITIIGAFLGFIAALWLDKYNENKKKIETKKNYIQSLLRDINTIKDKLNPIAQNGTASAITSQYFYFELPIWEAMVSAGEVNLFNNEAFFEDICELSAKIKTLNNLENNVMIAKLVNTKIGIETIREQKLKEIHDTCTILINKINGKT
ncbi:MAG: hypothetical protein FWC97_01435 [Treponema sp.]|nr:hypothetical protein [Treponema sp.]